MRTWFEFNDTAWETLDVVNQSSVCGTWCYEHWLMSHIETWHSCHVSKAEVQKRISRMEKLTKLRIYYRDQG